MIGRLNKVVAQCSCRVFASTLFVHGEPSVYGFGSDDTTNDPKMSVSSKNTIASLQQHIAEQDERIDGLTTIIEGLSASFNELQQSRGTDISSIQDNDSSNTALLKKLAVMIDEINANYVSKEELQQALSGKSVLKASIKPDKIEKTSLEGTSNAELYSEGVRFFVKKSYDEAQKRLTIKYKKEYKPAT